ncbi:MAG: ABC transporter permease [Lachnospiraceae bacterium]|nr:ABC transporter permease [Lachnospiraceae bacterium]
MKAWQRVFAYELAKMRKNRRELITGLIGLVLLLLLYEVVIVKLGEKDKQTEYVIYTDDSGSIIRDTEVGDFKLQSLVIQGSMKERLPLLLGDKFGAAVSFETNTVWYKSSDALSNTLHLYYTESLKRQKVVYNHPEVESALSSIAVEDLSNEKKYAQTMVGMTLPLMLLTLLTVRITSKTIEITSLEQKNGTLARVLLAPVSVRDLLLAKTLFACFYGIAASAVYITLIVVKDLIVSALGYGKDTTFLGAGLGCGTMLTLVLSVLLFSVLCASCAILFFSFGNGHKSTQLYTVFFTMGVYALVWLSLFRVGKITLAHYFVPFYDVALIMQDAIREDASVLPITITIGVNAILCIAIALQALRRCERENLAFDY